MVKKILLVTLLTVGLAMAVPCIRLNQGFESASPWPPTGWTQIAPHNPSWYRSNYGNWWGGYPSYCAYLYVYGGQWGNYDDYFVTPAISLAPPYGAPAQLDFWLNFYYYSSEYFRVVVGNTPTGPWTQLAYFSGGYYYYHSTINLSAYVNQTIYLGFHYYTSSSGNCWDIAFDSVIVRADSTPMAGGDIGVVRIMAPPDTVYTGISYTLRDSVKNFGTGPTTGTNMVRITCPGYPTYNDMTAVINIPGGATWLSTWPGTWVTPLTAGLTFSVAESASCSPDFNPANNKMTKTTVSYGDVAAVDGIEPSDPVYVNGIYNPQGRIQNMTPGNTERFNVRCQIIDEGGGVIYSKVVNDSLGPNQAKGVAFDDWKVPATVGAKYELNIVTLLPGDGKPANDVYAWFVTAQNQPGYDVGCDSITIPSASVKQGEVFKPRAWVHNYSTATTPQTFTVRCVIGSDTMIKSVVSLAKDDDLEVIFDDWSEPKPGSSTILVKTMLGGDSNPLNDSVIKNFTITAVNEGSNLPGRYALNAAKPNPVSNWTEISYNLPENTTASVAIYNVTGTLVRTLATGSQTAGYKAVRWDGRDASGAPAPNGLYFVRFNTPKYSATGKLVLTR